MAKGILAVAFDFSPTNPDEFHDWYDLEHLPERQAIEGFGRCERWLGTDDAHYGAATYDLDMVDVLKSGAYEAIRRPSVPWHKEHFMVYARLIAAWDGASLGALFCSAAGSAEPHWLNTRRIKPAKRAVEARARVTIRGIRTSRTRQTPDEWAMGCSLQ